jgi:hypothetical protein
MGGHRPPVWRKPPRGSLTIKVEEPEPGEPVSTLADAEAEREAYELP